MSAKNEDTGAPDEPERTDEELEEEELEDVSGGQTTPVGTGGSGFPQITKTPAGSSAIPMPFPNTTEDNDGGGTIDTGDMKMPDGDGGSGGESGG